VILFALAGGWGSRQVHRVLFCCGTSARLSSQCVRALPWAPHRHHSTRPSRRVEFTAWQGLYMGDIWLLAWEGMWCNMPGAFGLTSPWTSDMCWLYPVVPT